MSIFPGPQSFTTGHFSDNLGAVPLVGVTEKRV